MVPGTLRRACPNYLLVAHGRRRYLCKTAQTIRYPSLFDLRRRAAKWTRLATMTASAIALETATLSRLRP